MRYHAHGLLIASDVELALPRAADDDSRPVDLTLHRHDDRPVPATNPDGELVARVADRDGSPFYIITRTADTVTVRYPGLCEFVSDPLLRGAHVSLAPGQDPDVIPVLAGGLLLALHLRLRGELVLHASAVRVHDAALAFVGASGMGKSTMATLLCAAGHHLLTDDVLRVELYDEVAVARTGAVETRLREAARPLAASVVATSRNTADGRLAVAPAVHDGAPLPLAACVVPLPSRDHDRVQLSHLTGTRALMMLSRFPRIPGWVEPVTQAREFEQLADLVRRVGVFEARIPWGPPFPPEIPGDLLAGVGLSAAQR